MKPMKPAAKKALRCAIYTRVSTEHGLDQDFNSLDNQREAAEAYVKSQAHEGWKCLASRYDDGGFSGASMERPALQALLTEIKAGRIDVVVVYKVDRLTRSLADFAKLVELFDEHGVSFVSVTQAFNTTSSMGRLTLNVLLSFAQFEREVTGERIRDKIAASKKKGIWMGGSVPLGYRAADRALHIVEEHAAIIRTIFDRYFELGTATALHRHLVENGIIMPERIEGSGRRTGGKPFSRGHLYCILTNPIYIGQLSHKGWIHEGQHPAIIDQQIWDAVQAKLASNHHEHRRKRTSSESLLLGRIRDADGSLMTPTHAQKGSRRYRYYVRQAVLRGNGKTVGSIVRVSAPDIEAAVVEALRAQVPGAAKLPADADLVSAHLASVTVHPDRLELALTSEEDRLIQVVWAPPSSQRRREIILPPGVDPKTRPMKVEDRSRILRAIATGRSWLDDLTDARIDGTDAIALREGCTERSVRMTLSLAFLSPVIVRAIIEGRLPRGIGSSHLAELPASWSEQHRALGI
jgi:DNA invertase Pin-like site-specific DNA recombinase